MDNQIISLCQEIWNNMVHLGACTIKQDNGNKTKFIMMRRCEVYVRNNSTNVVSFFIYPDHISIYILSKEDRQRTYSIRFDEGSIEVPHITKYELRNALLYLLEQIPIRLFVE